MHPFILLATADNELGRFDANSLPDQTCMELLVTDLSKSILRLFRDENGAFHDVCKWMAVKCNADGGVTRVRFITMAWGGTVNLQYIPPFVKEFALENRKASFRLSGSLETAMLPQGLTKFTATWHGLDGTVDLATLPSPLVTFDIQKNFFTGSCDLASLPQNLKELNVRGNKMSGKIDLRTLPPVIQRLNLEENAFTREVDFQRLPETLWMLVLEGNSFTGEICMAQRKEGISVHCGRNKFAGIATVSSAGDVFVYLNNTDVEDVVDETGEQHRLQRMFMRGLLR